MLKTGLVSISFRDKSIDELINAVKKAGLDAIEWGGDIHVPHKDHYRAKEVKLKCLKEGIQTPSYGSYLKMEKTDLFKDVLENARILEADTIRVWAGTKGSCDANSNYYNLIAENIKKLASMANEYKISVSLEYHMKTLTDTYASYEKLMDKIDSDNVFGYFQPQVDRSYEENLDELKNMINTKKLSYVHVFNWDKDGKYPLADGMEKWQGYIKELEKLEGTRYLFLEFSCDNTISQFLEDARVLKEMIYTNDNLA